MSTTQTTKTTTAHRPKTNVRARSGSLVVEERVDTMDEFMDRSAMVNFSSQWVNAKGAWLIHIVMIIATKIFFDILPGVDQTIAWTLTNLTYNIITYIMFHVVKGVPFESNNGAYDGLTLWEQVDDGEQYTPARKFMAFAPIVLFLVSTHYAHYSVPLFLLNFAPLALNTISKMPQLHRIRIAWKPKE